MRSLHPMWTASLTALGLWLAGAPLDASAQAPAELTYVPSLCLGEELRLVEARVSAREQNLDATWTSAPDAELPALAAWLLLDAPYAPGDACSRDALRSQASAELPELGLGALDVEAREQESARSYAPGPVLESRLPLNTAAPLGLILGKHLTLTVSKLSKSAVLVRVQLSV